MIPTHPIPTVGRIVYFNPGDGKIRAAVVVAVHSHFSINLNVMAASKGDPCHGIREDVTHADPEKEPGCTPSWHWMPYQLAQANKPEIKGSLIVPPRDINEARRVALEHALQTVGAPDSAKVLKAARDYEAYLTGTDNGGAA